MIIDISVDSHIYSNLRDINCSTLTHTVYIAFIEAWRGTHLPWLEDSDSSTGNLSAFGFSP